MVTIKIIEKFIYTYWWMQSSGGGKKSLLLRHGSSCEPHDFGEWLSSITPLYYYDYVYKHTKNASIERPKETLALAPPY